MVKVYTSSRYKVHKKDLESFAQSYMDKRNIGEYNVNLIFVGKRKMKDIARTYVNVDVAKPVLSFIFNENSADSDDMPLLGEVYLCYPQVVLLAAERNKTVKATTEQLIEHGINNLLKG